jgi:hypothetical protein
MHWLTLSHNAECADTYDKLTILGKDNIDNKQNPQQEKKKINSKNANYYKKLNHTTCFGTVGIYTP